MPDPHPSSGKRPPRARRNPSPQEFSEPFAETPRLWLAGADGEIVSREPTLVEALDRIDELEQALHAAELDLRRKRATITELRGQLDTSPQYYDRADEVADIFREWATATGHLNARLTLDRFHAVRKLLDVSHPRPYPREAFSLAIAGAVHDPYRRRRKNGTWKVFDDLALICRDGEKFEDFIRRAPKETP